MPGEGPKKRKKEKKKKKKKNPKNCSIGNKQVFPHHREVCRTLRGCLRPISLVTSFSHCFSSAHMISPLPEGCHLMRQHSGEADDGSPALRSPKPQRKGWCVCFINIVLGMPPEECEGRKSHPGSQASFIASPVLFFLPSPGNFTSFWLGKPFLHHPILFQS